MTSTQRPDFPVAPLNAAGLNRQAVFDIAELPAVIQEKLANLVDDLSGYHQLILIGHGGRRLWDCVQVAQLDSADPIDDFTVRTLRQHFAEALPETAYTLLYPSEKPIGLQQLGTLAGWHNPSPFMVGIDTTWGSWSAYRAVILSATRFVRTPQQQQASPCPSCIDRPCVSICPADALSDSSSGFNLQKCTTYRKQADSPCQYTCLARCACPIGREHRYSTEQMRHVYGISLR
jgi:hypothetical protein